MKVSSEKPKWSPPPPFQRPKIEISGAGREWQWVYPADLKENDIVPDFGLIKHIEHYIVHDPREEIIKVVGAGKTQTFKRDPEVKVFAFTRKPT